MLNGGLWRVRFSSVCNLLKMERETGFEPATSSLGTPHGRLPQPPMKTASVEVAWNCGAN